MAFVLLYWKQIAAASIALAALAFAYHLGGLPGKARLADMRAKAEQTIAQAAKAEAAAVNKAREVEQGRGLALAAIAEQYERDKRDAQVKQNSLVADLRSGNRKLHERWQAAIATAELSGAVARASEPDAAERERQDSAARIIAAADRCDAQVKGLQDVVRADRK